MTQRFLPYSPDRDVYRLLQVDPHAGSDEVMDAWRRLARTFHPDRNGSRRATEEMQVVNAVRDLLSDPAARAEYDRERGRFMTALVRRGRTDRWRTLPRTKPQGGNSTDQPVTHDLESSDRRSLRASRLGRTAMALGFGLRAFALGLLPARCEACRGAIGHFDARCWICGFPTGTPRRPHGDES